MPLKSHLPLFLNSVLKKKEVTVLKKLEEKESELYNIKSELKNIKDSLAEKNKQMSGKGDGIFIAIDHQLCFI